VFQQKHEAAFVPKMVPVALILIPVFANSIIPIDEGGGRRKPFSALSYFFEDKFQAA
jgi:hypothetical protein